MTATTKKLVRELQPGDTIVAIGEHTMAAPVPVTRTSSKAVTRKRVGWFVFYGSRGFLPTGSDDERTCVVQAS